MADQRITQLTALSEAGLAAADVLPIADISASETKKITAKDLVEGAIALADSGSIDLVKLDQSSATKLGTTAIADDAVTAAKLANSSSVAVGVAAPVADNFEGRGYYNSSTGVLQVYSAGNYAAVSATVGTGAVGTTQLADGAVTTAKVDAAGLAAAALASNSVTDTKIANGAVTTAKLAATAVTEDKIGIGAVTPTKLSAGAVTYDKIQNTSTTDVVLGRSSAGGGTVQEIPVTAAGRALLDDASAADQRATLGLGNIALATGTWTNGSSVAGTTSGTNTGDQTITLTGDVTGTGTGSFGTTIANGVVTTGKIAAEAVTASLLAADSVTDVKLADNSAVIVAGGVPVTTGAFIGQQWVNTNTGYEYTWTGSEWKRLHGIATLTFNDTTPLAFAVTYPDDFSAAIGVTLDTQAASAVFVGPASGANAAPTFRSLVPDDLPNATAIAKGVVQPGTGLAVSAGVLNHANSIAGSTVNGITFDNQGHITNAVALAASNIPSLDASKITTGTFDTALLADDAVTGAKLADYSVAQFGETLPTAEYIGQFFFNPLDKNIYLWDGNVWQPVGVSIGELVFAGTYNATTNLVESTTSAGAAAGLVVGSALAAASAAFLSYYLVVSIGGTGTSPAPTVTLAPPDIILCDGTAWREIDVSSTYVAQTASNVGFTPTGTIGSTNAQSAIAEVATEAANASNLTSGTLAVARGGTNLASYTKGDIIVASGATTLVKLPVGTNGQVLTADSTETSGLKYTTPTVGTVTTVSSSTAALTVATATTTPALTIRSATTSVDGIVQLSDSTSTTSSTVAATSTAVKSAYDLANAALPKAGGVVTGALEIGSSGSLVFEGSTDDAFETTLAVADATADRTITLPNTTGTVITTGDTGTVTSTMIANGTVVDADINSAAAIAGTKISPNFGGQTIVTTGNVGIGTSSPARLLDVTPSSANAVAARFGNVAGRGLEISTFLTQTVNDAGVAFNALGAGVGEIAFQTDSAERLRIDSSGRVGIGTSSPASQLSVKGAVTVGETVVASIFQTEGTANSSASLWLSAIGDSNSGRGTKISAISNGNSAGNGHSLAFLTSANGAVPTERLRIDSSGNVGIGTSSPSGKLNILQDGTANTTPAIRITGSTGDPTNYFLDVVPIVSGSTVDYRWDLKSVSTNTALLYLSGAGRVGIGTSTPSTPLEVNGAARVTTIELGNASDTTLSRSAAGVLAVEGAVVPTVSSTNTLTNKTLTDPAIVGTILEDVFTITDGAAFEVDPSNGSVQLITLGAARTPKATNFAAGESITLMVDDGTANTLTWTDATWGSGGVKWVGDNAPALATAGYTVIQFWKVSTQVYGALVGNVA